MRKAISLFILSICLLSLAGCNQQDGNTPATTWDSNIVWDGTAPAGDVLPDFFEDSPKTAVFPEIMVGVWEVVLAETTGSKWGIKFEPDGSIKKINHCLGGPIDLAEGGVSMEGPDPGTYAVFEMGPCEARYNHRTKALKVKIVLDFYEMRLPSGTLRGRIEDYFSGPISEDGISWNVEWRSFGWLEGATLPEINYGKENPEKLVFTKINPESLEQDTEKQQDEQQPSQ